MECPGILAIGDAAHAMSPLGGVGINLAIQDAVAAANILAEPMADGKNPDPLLHLVQNKRMGPTRHMQSLQKLIQDRIIGTLLESGTELQSPPLAVRSEEHRSELQSLMRISYAVFCLKKKNES